MPYGSSSYDGNIVPSDIDVSSGGLPLPQWTTAGRPANPGNGTIGYNTTTNSIETYMLGRWININIISAI